MDKLIFFTKAPNFSNSKTRLKNFLNGKQRRDLMVKLIKKNYKVGLDTDKGMSIYYEGEIEDLSYIDGEKKAQEGNDLGEKMINAIFNELEDFQKVVLYGSDLENLTTRSITEAFEKLNEYDFVISPTTDGGFGLIAMKEKVDILTNITYSTERVLEDILDKIKSLDRSYFLLETIRDIDDMRDLIVAEFGDDRVEDLANGEYNLNYRLNDKVIRINLASQMNLSENQLKYEYDALKVLEKSGVTPKVYDYYPKGRYFEKSFLTMEYVEGRPLSYEKDMEIAAKLLSSVHNLDADYSNFIFAKKPFRNMYDEFISMFSHYQNYSKKDKFTEDKILEFLKIAENSGLDTEIENPCIINTELNNRNFIIGDKSVIIDWEKPIIGESEQDLAHFLVPTTTNWKTQTVLNEDQMLNFLKVYENYRHVDYKKFYKYLMFNSLRGITWCAMAKVEYDGGRFINNPETEEKINKFLSKSFLQMLEKYYRRFDEQQ